MADKFPEPDLGRQVRYVLNKVGDIRTATIVLVHEPDEEGERLVNLNVFIGKKSDVAGTKAADETNIFFPGIKFDPAKAPYTWHWPEKMVAHAPPAGEKKV